MSGWSVGAVSERAPYSRVYWSIMDDPKFDGIRDDCRVMGAWLLLLVQADMSHPAPAHLPRTVPSAATKRLGEAGLIDILTGHRYRIRGLDAERERRKSAATRDPSGSQSGPKREAVGRIDETRRDEHRQDEADDGRADLEAFLIIKRRAPSPRQRQLLDDVLMRHDLTGPAWAADVMYRHPDDPIGAVIEEDKAWRAERIRAAQEAERPKPIPRRPRGIPQSTRELMAEWSATLQSENKAS